MTKQAKRASKRLDRLVQFLDRKQPAPVGKRFALDEPSVAPLLALAKKHDAQVHALMDVIVRKNTSFCVFDVELFPENFLRGKKGEAWNASKEVLGDADVALAKNGAGDLYVWNAERGDVRFVLHDEGWKARRTYPSPDAFFEQ